MTTTMSGDGALLEIRDLGVAYGDAHRALSGVSLSVDDGETLGLTGESGSGKTTLLHAAGRLLRAPAVVTAGTVAFDGGDVYSLDPRALRRLRWNEIAIVTQSAMNALNPVIRIDSLMREICRRKAEMSRQAADRRIDEVLELVSIPAVRVRRSYAHQLSGGMRQRVVIAMALLCSPRLLLADEPTTGLDVIVQSEILACLSRLQSELGFAMVLVSHDLGVIAQSTQRLAVMRSGEIVESGPSQTVIHAPTHPYTRELVSSYLTVEEAPTHA